MPRSPVTVRTALLLLLTACAVRRPPSPWLADVEITGLAPEGRGSRWNPDLPALNPERRASAQEARWTSWVAERSLDQPVGHWWQRVGPMRLIGEPPVLDADLAAADADQLQAWLQAQGFVDPTVTWQVAPADRWWVKPDVTWWRSIHYTVDAGPRRLLAEIALEGADELPAFILHRLTAALPEVGSPWSDARSEALEHALRAILKDGDRPDAHAHVVIYETDAAPVVRGGDAPTAPSVAAGLLVRVEALPPPAYGVPLVTGVDGRLKASLERAVARRLPADATWDGRRVESLRQILSRMPGVQDLQIGAPDPRGVPVVVQAASEVKVGRSAGLGSSGALLSISQGFGVDVGRVGGTPWRLRADSDLGWRLFTGSGTLLDLVRLAQTGPGLRMKMDLEGRFAPEVPLGPFASMEGAVEAWTSHIQMRSEGELGLRARPSARTTLELGVHAGWSHHMRPFGPLAGYYEAFDPVATGGLGYQTTSTMWAPFARLRFDSRDDGMLSHRGLTLDAEVMPYGQIGGQPFSRGSGDLTWFAPIHAMGHVGASRAVLVTRASFGLRSYDDTLVGDALMGKFFIGGPWSMRGFGFRRNGPVGSPGGGNDVQRGGDAMLYGSVEGRFFVHPDLAVVAFVDAGRTWDAVTDLRGPGGQILQRGVHLEDLVPVVGAGTLFRSPLGFFGLWFGVRLTPDMQMEGGQPGVFNLQLVGLRGRDP